MKPKLLRLEKLWFDKAYIFIQTEDRQIKHHPLRWFPKLANATEEQRNNYRVSPFGIHWEELTEDLSVEGFFNYDLNLIHKTMKSKEYFKLSGNKSF